MAIEVRLPNLGESIAHARLGQWVKRPGDRVSRGDVIAEVETDKTSVEIEAPDDGILATIHVPAGTEHVAVGQLLAVLEASEVTTAGADVRRPASNAAAPVREAVAPAAEPPGRPAESTDVIGHHLPPVEPTSAPAHETQLAATALARRMAVVAGLSLSALRGSGADGIVTKADVDRALAAVATHHSATHYAPGAFDVVRLSPMRRVAAERLTQAKQQIPHFYLHIDCDMDAICTVRDDLNARADAKLSLTAFSLRAAALALRRVPSANTTWVDGVLRAHKTVDLAVAVNTPLGLVAPVLRGADQKSVVALNAEMRALAERARDGKLSPDEYAGGTCTISNLGMFGIRGLYPIINPPQTCILGVGAVEERPAVRDHQLTIARTMTCTLSADHRALDGAAGAEFLSAFRALVEDPWALLM